MRKAAGYLSIFMGVALLFLATAGSSQVWAWSNATAGIVKDTGSGTAICTFHVQGTAWDSRATGVWDIKLATTNTIKASGSWTANSSGAWTTARVTTLANGNYTLHVRQSTPQAGDNTYVNYAVHGGTRGDA